MNAWKSALKLNPQREVIEGSAQALSGAIGRGADLRILTDFHHNEHIDTSSSNPELIRETSEFRVTYLIEGRWAAGIMSLRQPVNLPDGFGPRPSLSCFLYNQDGNQAIARLYLDGPPARGGLGPSPAVPPENMPKYHAYDAWDAESNGPSSNFVYDFDVYEFFVRDDWTEVLRADGEGRVVSGSVAALTGAFRTGSDVKVAVSGICSDLAAGGKMSAGHELFVQTGFNYHYTEQELFIAETHPIVRVAPSIPMRYTTRGWDFGWLIVRTDGTVYSLIYDPYTLEPRRKTSRHAVRWFVR